MYKEFDELTTEQKVALFNGDSDIENEVYSQMVEQADCMCEDYKNALGDALETCEYSNLSPCVVTLKENIWDCEKVVNGCRNLSTVYCISIGDIAKATNRLNNLYKEFCTAVNNTKADDCEIEYVKVVRELNDIVTHAFQCEYDFGVDEEISYFLYEMEHKSQYWIDESDVTVIEKRLNEIDTKIATLKKKDAFKSLLDSSKITVRILEVEISLPLNDETYSAIKEVVKSLDK